MPKKPLEARRPDCCADTLVADAVCKAQQEALIRRVRKLATVTENTS
jgi:hypothetical protein